MTRKEKGDGGSREKRHDASVLMMTTESSSCFSMFCNRFHLKHNRTIKRAFVVLSKTLDNTLGWLTRVLWGWSSSSSSSWCDCGFAGVVGVGCQRKERKRESVGEWGGKVRLVEEDAALDGFAADGALAHPVSTQLAGAVAAHEDHVLQPVQTHRTHGLRTDEEERSHFMFGCNKVTQIINNWAKPS